MEAVRSKECGQAPVCACAGAFAFAVFMLLLPVPKAFAARLGGPYYVDDAEIGKVGSCEMESWNSSAGNGDPFNHVANGLILNVPVTFDFSRELRLNINVGAQYNADPGALYATAGAGVSWNFMKQWSVISEVFALIGPGATNPRFQSGIRYSPTKDVDWDVIYGRNLTGEGSNWITLALTFRISEN